MLGEIYLIWGKAQTEATARGITIQLFEMVLDCYYSRVRQTCRHDREVNKVTITESLHTA